jgi:hypothetical protein
MAESSPVIGQFRQTFNFSSPSSSHSVVAAAAALSRGPSSPAAVPSTPPPPSQKLHPLTFDPLQGLIHEMALSAVIQKHTAISLPSSITHSSAASSTLPTTYVQNIVVQPPPHTPSPSTPSPDSQHHNTPTLAQPHNLIAVTSAASAANATKAISTMNPMPFLTQGGPPLYGTPIALQQFGAAAGQEVAVSASAAGTPIVQLAPVGYATPTGTAQGDNRAAIFQQTAGVIG